MKKILTLFAVVGLIVFSSCEGPEGPEGPQGPEGPISEVFEVQMDFTSANNFGKTFPLSPKIYSGDNLLVYLLVNTNNGIDTWALLPQVYYFPSGTAQYNYEFSYDQFSILVDASFPLTQLPTAFTTGKVFRVVIVPGDDGVNKGGPNSKKSASGVDYSDYNAVIKKYNIDDSNVKKLN
ncbi:hypothetical protein [[Flexibacter] sp. ATCC 35103]|uniref:hypothetical protein n=1 Tax=[Flexibacter] sp. ATCC 35103 TaxID=1937528 RepID=UPI0009D44CBA|nr:hypothetical protein [[Flexibacter] sp. ATCC 35103]OMQ13752.1 hypothetical protein BXU01_04110 [[Flexibacter] sp. ATCC 35103]